MSEWHLSPDYIVNNWTDELLNLMTEKLSERKRREYDAMKGVSTTLANSGARVVSNEELFAQMGNKIKVVKRGD